MKMSFRKSGLVLVLALGVLGFQTARAFASDQAPAASPATPAPVQPSPGPTPAAISQDDADAIILDRQLIMQQLDKDTKALGEIVAEVRGKVTALSARRTYKVATGGKNYTVTLEPDLEDGGYVVECPSLPGCMSQGETIAEALTMIRDAIRGHLAVVRKDERSKKIGRAA